MRRAIIYAFGLGCMGVAVMALALARRSRSGCSCATGRNDNCGLRNGKYDESGDWFYQNVRLMKAITQKGYDVNSAWGLNGHGQKFGGAILPDMMRWLWRDGPVSTDPKDSAERAFREPAANKKP
jgi:enterochelin esterase family protein